MNIGVNIKIVIIGLAMRENVIIHRLNIYYLLLNLVIIINVVFLLMGEKSSVLIHKLVYSLFKDDYNEQKQINHIDGNKQNNVLDNLELITCQQNVLHSYYVLYNNIFQIGQFDMQNNLIATYDSMSAAARAIDGSVSAISQVCAGKAKTHKDFIWKKIV